MFRITLLMVVILLASCGNEQINVETDRDASAAATYTVKFTSDWKQTNFPTNFPVGAHFTGLIGGTHSVQVKFWEVGAGCGNLGEPP